MDGYSKIKIMDSQNSRSTDFSDLVSFSTTPKSTTNPTSKIPETNLQIKNTTTTQLDCYSQDEQGGRFGGGVELKRNRSVSSSSSASSGFQSAVKGAMFSMRRSSSTVSERYCRIHDQSAALTSPIDDEEPNWGATTTATTTTTTTRSVKKKQRGGKIFKACKRLFGL